MEKDHRDPTMIEQQVEKVENQSRFVVDSAIAVSFRELGEYSCIY